MSRRRGWIVAGIIGLAFLYGFAAGSYRLPPFYQIAWLKNSITARLSPPAPEYEPPTATSATILETALQRLLVKRIQLPNSNDEFVGGGALTTTGDVLYAVSSGGYVTALDVASTRRLDAAIDTVPLNRSELMLSRARYAITLFWFRVSGAHAEAVDDSTHRLFVAHNRFDAARECFTFNLSRTTVVRRGDRVESRGGWETIYTSAPCMTLQGKEGFGRHPWSGHISGGKMISYDRDRLLVTVGDFNYDGYLRESWPMDRRNPYGKFLLVDKITGTAETYAIGARNDMGLFRDSSGTIWATESGPQGGDELNIVERGANYGWPKATYGIGYESSEWEPADAQGRHDGYRRPVFAWVPSIVPTNLVRIEGHPGSFEPWRGDLLFGTLRDQALHRVRLDSADRVIYDERIPFGERIRDLLRLSDGRIVLLTDATGNLVFIEDGAAEYMPVDSAVRARLAAMDRYDAFNDPRAAVAPVVGGEDLFTQKCAACHALDGRTIQGPSLSGVVGRGVGALPGFDYSTVLATDDREWTPNLLVRFLMHPETDFVNTRMQKVSMTRTQADSIIAYLGRLRR